MQTANSPSKYFCFRSPKVGLQERKLADWLRSEPRKEFKVQVANGDILRSEWRTEYRVSQACNIEPTAIINPQKKAKAASVDVPMRPMLLFTRMFVPKPFLSIKIL